MPPRPPRLTLFPYTTLFRSARFTVGAVPESSGSFDREITFGTPLPVTEWKTGAPQQVLAVLHSVTGSGRSEEHTSELQSRENLVCRLLLEKKKKKRERHI